MKKLLIRICPFLYMALIWLLSSKPADAVVDSGLSYDDFIKESLHLIEFGILYLLFVLLLKQEGKFTKKMNLIVAIISILYGLTDEIHQAFVPSRSATVIDFIKDTIGVLVAYYFIHKKYFEIKPKN